MTAARRAALRKATAASAAARRRRSSTRSSRTRRRTKIPRSRYTGKREVPHVEYGRLSRRRARAMGLGPRSGGRGARYANVRIGNHTYGGLLGRIQGKTLVIHAVSGATNRRAVSPTLEPGISALTAAARMTPRGGRMQVVGAIPSARAFYELTGGVRGSGGRTRYSEAARQRLASRRIVRVKAPRRQKKQF